MADIHTLWVITKMNRKGTFKEIISDIHIDSEDALLEIADKIFINESTETIKEKATQEAFNLFIGVQIIGCWKSGGWAVGVFGNFPEITPYASDVLRAIGLNDIADKVLDIIEAFPKETDFTQNNQNYCNVINFLEGRDRFIKDKNKYEKNSDSEKLSIRQNYKDSIKSAENLAEKVWADNSPNLEGWGTLTNYLRKNINAKL